MATSALAKFQNKWRENKFVCVGLDPTYEELPQSVRQASRSESILTFNKEIIDQTIDLALAYKPNAAFYEAEGEVGFKILRETIEYIHKKDPEMPVILDAKRADIGNTNRGYVKSAFEDLGADSITIHPYLGATLLDKGIRKLEALAPFIERDDKIMFVLARTSNPSAGEFQDLPISIKHLSEEYKSRFGDLEKLIDIAGSDTVPLYQVVAYIVANHWSINGNLGLVVGATYPNELDAVRRVAPSLPIIMPGLGAQGGDIKASVKAGLDSHGQGLVV